MNCWNRTSFMKFESRAVSPPPMTLRSFSPGCCSLRWRSLPRASNAAQRAKLDACTAAVRDGCKVVLEMEAVIGATVLLLAESVEWLDPFPD